jgi:hypothetical protein
MLRHQLTDLMTISRGMSGTLLMQRFDFVMIGGVNTRNDVALDERLEASDKILPRSFIAIGLDQHAVRTLRYRKKRIRLRSHD